MLKKLQKIIKTLLQCEHHHVILQIQPNLEMGTVMMITRNPVLWQELLYQTRNTPRVQRLELLIALLLAGGIVGGASVLLQNGRTSGGLASQFMLIALWSFSAVVMIRSIVAGANAISREHVGQTWDALVLTGISARRIMLGKWLASMRRVMGWGVALAAVRLFTLPLFMYAMTQTYVWFSFRRNNPISYEENFTTIGWVPWSTGLGVLVAIIMPFVEIAACTALGVAASALTKRAPSAAVLAGLVRFIPIALTLHAGFVRYNNRAPMYRWWRFPSFSVADSGTVLMMRMVQPEMEWTRGQHVWALTNLTGPIALLFSFLLVSLIITLIIVKRRGALPHQQRSEAEVQPRRLKRFFIPLMGAGTQESVSNSG